MKDKILSKYFLIFLIILASLACILLFKSFLIEIIIAAVLASVFYKPFTKLSKFLKGRQKLAAFLMSLFLLLIIVIPISTLVIQISKKAPTAYIEMVEFVNTTSANFKNNFSANFGFDLSNSKVESVILNSIKKVSDWLASAVPLILKGTSNFIISLVLMLLTTFFFFIDGRKMLAKLKLWSPLPNKYDLIIFKKFREISFSALISTFVTAGIQGVIGIIGFLIVGVPALFPGLLLAFACLIPYVGGMIVYVPIGIYLILAGQIWQGIFILIWGAVIIGNADNVIRAYILHGTAKINPIFLIFALMGGIILFGFWGLVLGPLILSLIVTIFSIYELEYGKDLEEVDLKKTKIKDLKEIKKEK